MLKNVSNNFIQNCNSTELTYNEYIVIDNEQIPIRAKLSDDCYENGNFIGSFILKTIQFETSNDVDFKQKEFEYYKVVNGESIKIGTFITTEVQDNDTTELVKVVGMDYGLKTQIEYKSELDYDSGQITLLDVWNEACTLSGLQSGIQHFTNDNFIVDSDQFTGTGATIRDVFIGIAMSSGSFVKVMNDDKIYLIFTENTTEVVEDYTDLEDKRDTHPITCVRLGLSAVEGENVDLKDQELIEQYGENWLILNDNPFAYTEAKRGQLITAIFNKVKGFGYSAFVSKTSFKPYLTCGDKIKFRNRNGQLVDSIILRYTHEYKEKDMQIKLEAPSETSATVNYVYPLSAIDISKRTEIIVDKQDQTITELAEEVGEYDDRITTVEQSVDRIEQTAVSYEDLKRQEQGVNMLHITNAFPDYPLKFTIRNMSLTFPSTELYPSESLFPKDSYLVIDKTQALSQDAKFIKLPITVLYQKDQIFDEFVVEKKTAYIIHRIGVNQDGTLYILENETIENLGEIDIELFEGDNYIYLYSFQNDGVIYKIEYTIPSEFTKTFATEIYVNSSITQTANEIMLQVDEKVDENEIIAKLNIAVEDGQGIINLTGNTVTIDSDNFKLDEEGNIQCNDAIMNNATMNNSIIKDGSINMVSEDIDPTIYIGSRFYPDTTILSANGMKTATQDGTLTKYYNNGMQAEYNGFAYLIASSALSNSLGHYGVIQLRGTTTQYSTETFIDPTQVQSPAFINTSSELKKKNFEKVENGLDIIKDIDIYKYNYQEENKKSNKKHYGLVIGEKFNYSKEITNDKNDGVDIYGLASVCVQAIKEQQEQIEKLKKEINKLKGGK